MRYHSNCLRIWSTVRSEVGLQAWSSQVKWFRPNREWCVRKLQCSRFKEEETRMRAKTRKERVTKSRQTTKPERKAPGTRYGTLEDWRGSDGRTGKPSGGRNAFRDGR